MKATIDRFEYWILKRMALLGVDWEISNSIGVPDNEAAMAYVKMMKETKRKIQKIKPKYHK